MSVSTRSPRTVSVLVGGVIGLGAALAGSRVLTKFLFEVPATDAVTYAAAPAVVLLVASAACVLAARRALRVPPMLVLKGE